jgi:hypothetical protein
MLSAWEPISLTRSTESSLWPALQGSTGERFDAPAVGAASAELR